MRTTWIDAFFEAVLFAADDKDALYEAMHSSA